MLWAVITSAVFVGYTLSTIVTNAFERWMNKRRFERFDRKFRPDAEERAKLESVVKP